MTLYWKAEAICDGLDGKPCKTVQEVRLAWAPPERIATPEGPKMFVGESPDVILPPGWEKHVTPGGPTMLVCPRCARKGRAVSLKRGPLQCKRGECDAPDVCERNHTCRYEPRAQG